MDVFFKISFFLLFFPLSKADTRQEKRVDGWPNHLSVHRVPFIVYGEAKQKNDKPTTFNGAIVDKRLFLTVFSVCTDWKDHHAMAGFAEITEESRKSLMKTVQKFGRRENDICMMEVKPGFKFGETAQPALIVPRGRPWINPRVKVTIATYGDVVGKGQSPGYLHAFVAYRARQIWNGSPKFFLYTYEGEMKIMHFRPSDVGAPIFCMESMMLRGFLDSEKYGYYFTRDISSANDWIWKTRRDFYGLGQMRFNGTGDEEL